MPKETRHPTMHCHRCGKPNKPGDSYNRAVCMPCARKAQARKRLIRKYGYASPLERK